MSLNTQVGFRLYELDGGLVSRQLRLQVAMVSRPRMQLPPNRHFHSSPPNRAWPLLGVILGGLKSSTALSMLNTVVRIAMTFIPAFIVKSKFLNKLIKKIPTHFPQWEYKIPHLMKHLRWNSLAIRVLLFVPITLVAITMLASLERAPLTGRWRFILISPNEEEEIVASLSKTWFDAVNSVLASTLETGTPPPTLPPTDWRYNWVQSTLRRLEAAVPLLQAEQASNPNIWNNDRGYPFPPPPQYPLVARPRTAQVLHSWAEQAQYEEQPQITNPLVGPPYSCLVVEKPDSQNAFSYGFGPNGAGGVVVYTGFLDEVLKPEHHVPPEIVNMPSFWSRIFGSLFGSLMTPPKRQPEMDQPCEKQTAELAVLLAHELSHLLLLHHLETLSSGTILYPSVASIITDVTRTIIFPFTMLLGPFVNDALGQIGRVQGGEIGRLSEMCNGRKLEIEADIVSARLLAYAGFDPREAIKFWETRIDESKRAECAVQGKTRDGTRSVVSWAMGRSETHPLHEERIRRLKEELESWNKAWAKISKPERIVPVQ